MDRLKSLIEIKKSTEVKILFSVGGWANSQYMSQIARSAFLQDTFIKSIVSIINTYSFDGVDIGTLF